MSKKLNDIELHKIRLYDLRHFYATMLNYRTKDILLVKEKLGHRNINNTLVYTDRSIEQAAFSQKFLLTTVSRR